MSRSGVLAVVLCVGCSGGDAEGVWGPGADGGSGSIGSTGAGGAGGEVDTSGSSASTGVHVSQGGSGGEGGGTPAPCGPATCEGCCDERGACLAGEVDVACGAGGVACVACEDRCDPAASSQVWCQAYAVCSRGVCGHGEDICCTGGYCNPSRCP